jgi:hypothetical protein
MTFAAGDDLVQEFAFIRTPGGSPDQQEVFMPRKSHKRQSECCQYCIRMRLA